jgi:ketosteroid isomerase-like protein
MRAALAADAKAQITDLKHKCAATTSVDELMKCYYSSDELVVYDVGTPREFDGPKAVRADFQNFFDSVKDVKIEFVSLHVVTDGKLALANSHQRFTGVGKDGKPEEGTLRVTECLAQRRRQLENYTHARFLPGGSRKRQSGYAIEAVALLRRRSFGETSKFPLRSLDYFDAVSQFIPIERLVQPAITPWRCERKHQRGRENGYHD